MLPWWQSLEHNTPKIGEFMAYQKIIVQAHRRYMGDSCYQRQAAITKSLNWDQVDFNLYNELFTGKAKASTRCSQCMMEHASSEPFPYTDHKSATSVAPAKSGKP